MKFGDTKIGLPVYFTTDANHDYPNRIVFGFITGIVSQLVDKPQSDIRVMIETGQFLADQSINGAKYHNVALSDVKPAKGVY
jgi:hypothetical protein